MVARKEQEEERERERERKVKDKMPLKPSARDQA
jgi:hypothetical protein